MISKNIPHWMLQDEKPRLKIGGTQFLVKQLVRGVLARKDAVASVQEKIHQAIRPMLMQNVLRPIEQLQQQRDQALEQQNVAHQIMEGQLNPQIDLGVVRPSMAGLGGPDINPAFAYPQEERPRASSNFGNR